MESMIERVARAIQQNVKVDATGLSPAVAAAYIVGIDEAARAAIEAMREPTDAMVDSMNDVDIDGPAYVTMNASMADCAAIFAAGINAALNEQPS